ncbi:MAG: rhomboid family intramembrane serine protease [Myxococcaceae bacterium]
MFFFLPTGSNAERGRRPVVTFSIFGVCAAMYVWTNLLAPPSELLMFTTGQAQAYAKEHPWLLDKGEPPDELVDLLREKEEFQRLYLEDLDRYGGPQRQLALVPKRGLAQVGWISNVFIHFGFMHLAGNLLFLWIVGPLLEEAWGRRRFLGFYLLAGLVASLAQYLVERKSGVSIGGASGAIAGCMGAFTVRFALTRIRFHYFLWFLRIFVGSVFVPAWICGLVWFLRELMDLSGGGAQGVATAAHVGGFMLGGATALGIKALGFDRLMLTVAETNEERERREGWFQDAIAALARSDFDAARELLTSLQKEVPDYPGLALLFGEVDLRAGKGHARLERALRPFLDKRDGELEAHVQRLWPFVDATAFSQAFAWKLAERLAADPKFADEVVALWTAVATGSGSLAIKARKALEHAPKRQEKPRAIELDAPVDLSAPPPDEPPEKPPLRMLPSTVTSVTAAGLGLVVEGTPRTIPWAAIASVHAGLVERVLRVEIGLRTKPPAVLALSSEDPAVPKLFPGQAVPAAWQAFLAGVRRASQLPAVDAWSQFASREEFEGANDFRR